MDKSIVERILKLNSDFYQLHGDSFSNSRSKAWEGWGRVLKNLYQLEKDNLKIVDLGSGNGRFYDYLRKNFNEKFDYLAVDTSEVLLNNASKRYGKFSNYKQQKVDVILNLEKINNTFDVTVAFGLTHHIPSDDLRKSFFEKTADLTKQNGVLVLSFWYPKESKFISNKEFDSKSLDTGDFFMGWGNKKDAVRFVHIYSDGDINKLVALMKEKSLFLLDKFTADITSKSSNLYLIFKKE
jgi:SAM-dependent methyltransferase